jgi:hypothetical protein
MMAIFRLEFTVSLCARRFVDLEKDRDSAWLWRSDSNEFIDSPSAQASWRDSWSSARS